MIKIIVSVLFSGTLIANAAERSLELNLELAQKLAAKASACGTKNKWKLSVAVVNAEGNLMYFHRGDGAYFGSIEAAIDKAKSSNAFQRPTKGFSDSLKEGRTGLLTVKNVVGIEGGLPIQIGEKFVGGIGVSGARAIEDEQCAKEALDSLEK